MPLVFQHGVTHAVFLAAVALWAAFEFAMRVLQRLRARWFSSGACARPVVLMLVAALGHS